MKTYIIGDTHGSFKPIRDFMQRCPQAYQDGMSNMIVLGDFGGNFFFNKRDEEYKKKLGTYPLTYFIIRGNHEERPSNCAKNNPDAWTKEKYFDGMVWVEKAYPYIKYAMDYPSWYTINGYKTLVIPGAYSVDKFYRLQNDWGWFKDEQLTEEEMKYGLEMIGCQDWKFDMVLSHTCPICYELTDLFLSFIDQNMIDKTMERYLGTIEHNLDYKLWLFGHYHTTRVYPNNDGKQMMMLFNDKVIELEDWMNSLPTKAGTFI